VCGNQGLGSSCTPRSISIAVLKGVGDPLLSFLGTPGMVWVVGNFGALWLDFFLGNSVAQFLCMFASSLRWFNMIISCLFGESLRVHISGHLVSKRLPR
jgi:hypothetical protein